MFFYKNEKKSRRKLEDVTSSGSVQFFIKVKKICKVGPNIFNIYGRDEDLRLVCWGCTPSWRKLEDVTSSGSVQVPADTTTRLDGCLEMCAYKPSCVGIEYRYSDSAPCRYFPSSASSIIESTAQPAARTVQYRLVDRCYRGTSLSFYFTPDQRLLPRPR